jgi:hypothetical protein
MATVSQATASSTCAPPLAGEAKELALKEAAAATRCVPMSYSPSGLQGVEHRHGAARLIDRLPGAYLRFCTAGCDLAGTTVIGRAAGS